MDDLLHLVQDLLARFAVELGRLLLEQLVEIGVAAIRVDAALHGEYFEAGGGVAEAPLPPWIRFLNFFSA